MAPEPLIRHPRHKILKPLLGAATQTFAPGGKHPRAATAHPAKKRMEAFSTAAVDNAGLTYCLSNHLQLCLSVRNTHRPRQRPQFLSNFRYKDVLQSISVLVLVCLFSRQEITQTRCDHLALRR